ncbi:hypothetical protein DFH09DRAFT_1068781 [Mycena vulgaris]|nr:hypothetical protein DFH09DRAFT_1068781 [Mycena vulgaris]
MVVLTGIMPFAVGEDGVHRCMTFNPSRVPRYRPGPTVEIKNHSGIARQSHTLPPTPARVCGLMWGEKKVLRRVRGSTCAVRDEGADDNACGGVHTPKRACPGPRVETQMLVRLRRAPSVPNWGEGCVRWGCAEAQSAAFAGDGDGGADVMPGIIWGLEMESTLHPHGSADDVRARCRIKSRLLRCARSRAGTAVRMAMIRCQVVAQKRDRVPPKLQPKRWPDALDASGARREGWAEMEALTVFFKRKCVNNAESGCPFATRVAHYSILVAAPFRRTMAQLATNTLRREGSAMIIMMRFRYICSHHLSQTTTSMCIELATKYYSYDVPVEVWLMCWSPCSLRQLRRISLVWKLFRSLVLPQLFREQSFDVMALAQARGLDHGNWRERVHRLHRTAARLDRLAEVPSPLWVHTLKVFFGPRTPLHYLHLSIDKIHLFDTLQGIRMDLVFPMTLSRYRNILTLHIGHTAIDPPFREALQSLPKLKDLLLRDCLIHVGETVPLSILTITLCSSMRLPVRLADPETLHTLAFDVVPNTAITFGSATSTLSNLVDLSIQEVHAAGKFVRLLAQCPHLINLSVNSVAVPAVSPDIIPRLRSLSAPRTLVHILGPGRPISRVLLTDKLHRELLMPLYTAISQAIVPLKSLHLPCERGFLDPLAAIASLFPGLTELSLEFLERPVFRCGTRNVCRRDVLFDTMTGPPHDRRTLKLDDEGAFDGDMPVDDISDVESEREDLAPILVVEQAASEPTQARSISRSMSMLWLPPVDQHQAIARLSRLYPQLREIKLGSLGGSWVRTGNSWARDVSGAREEILVFRGLKPDPWMGWSDEWPSSWLEFAACP